MRYEITLFVVAVAFSLPASGGTMYHHSLGALLFSANSATSVSTILHGYAAQFTTETVGLHPDGVRTADLISAGKSARIDLRDGAQLTSSVIQSSDGGHVVLNHRLKTFYRPTLPMGAGATAQLSQPPWKLTPSAKVQLQALEFSQKIRRDDIDGRSSDLHRLTLSFKVTDKLGSENVVSKVSVRLEFWTTALNPPLHAIDPQNFSTGFPEIDARVRDALSSMTGTVVKLRAEISRSVSGGPASTGIITTVVSNIREKLIPADTFSVPPDYRFEEPAYKFPRMGKEGE